MVGGNTGIGIPAGLADNPTLGKLVVRGTVGAVSAIFGDKTAGVTIMNNLPSIGFNYYYNAGSKAISTGFGASLGQDPANGRIYLASSATSITGAGTAMPLVDRLIVLANGNTGIAAPNPLATLQVGKGAGSLGGTAQFDGTTYSSHFSYSTTEDTYIRGGKATSQVIINDQGNGNIRLAENGANVGIGNPSPQAPLSFSNATGNKLDIYYGSATSRYGIGWQGGLMQFYSGTASDDIAFGYGSSTAFTERMRIKGNGNVGIGINTPVNKLSVSDNSATDAVKLYNAGTGSALYALSSGGSAINAIAFNQNNPAIKVQGGSVSISTDGKVEIGGNIKISGGSPKIGQVLTATSTTGEATWKAAAYGNTERFQFLYRTASGVNSGTTLYNTGSAQASFSNTGSFMISINIAKIGLYHFDVNASSYMVDGVSDFDQASLSIEQPAQPAFKMTTFSAFYTSGNVTRASADKSFDIYIGNPGIMNFYYSDGFRASSTIRILTVTGHLISD